MLPPLLAMQVMPATNLDLTSQGNKLDAKEDKDDDAHWGSMGW